VEIRSQRQVLTRQSAHYLRLITIPLVAARFLRMSGAFRRCEVYCPQSAHRGPMSKPFLHLERLWLLVDMSLSRKDSIRFLSSDESSHDHSFALGTRLTLFCCSLFSAPHSGPFFVRSLIEHKRSTLMSIDVTLSMEENGPVPIK